MPTSGESGIVPSSTYNLRSKPLPKTSCRPTTRSSNKENIGTRKVTTSTRSARPTKRAEQSKIPAPNSKIPVTKSRIPAPKTNRSTASKTTAASGTPTRRKVPDFEKLHKSWNKKFQQGKAVAKKPCTQTAAFDLTRPGTEFRRAYYDGTKKDVRSRRQTGFGFRADDDFHVDDGALNDILNGEGLEEEEKEESRVSSRATLAGTGVSAGTSSHLGGRRQTLGQLPSTGAGRVNNSSNILSDREISKPVMDRGKKSLSQEQRDAGLTFETSADSLASILNNTGLHSSHKQHAIMGGRQTIGGMSAQQRQSGRSNVTTGRTSIYYQKPKNHDVTKVYSEFAKRTLSRFTMDGNQASFKNEYISSLLPDNRGSIYFKPTNPAPEKPVTDRPNSSAALNRTPGTAARIPNPRFKKQDQSCSPALTPARRIPTTPGGQSQKNVRWADVLSSPSEGEIADQTKDVVAVLNFGDDCDDVVSPKMKTRLQEVEKIEAETVLNRQKLNEMEEIEKQLELEIARLHEAGDREDLEEPVCQPASTEPQSHPNSQRVDPSASNILDIVPTKQPANYLDPVKLSTAYKAETTHVPTPENTTHGYSTRSETHLQQHGTREVQHLQDSVQRGQTHMQASHLERGVSHQNGDIVQPREIYYQSAVSSRGIDVRREEPSSFALPSGSRGISALADKPSTVHPEVSSNSVVDPAVHEVGHMNDGSLRLQSPGSRLMVSDSTEAFCGVFPQFLQNSYQPSKQPVKYPGDHSFQNNLTGQENALGHSIMHASSAVKTDIEDSFHRLRVDMDRNRHHRVADKDNEFKMFSMMQSYDHSKTIATTNPHDRRAVNQSFVPQSSVESNKPHIPHDTSQAFSVPTKPTAPTDNPRLTIHTPQPSRAAPRGTSFLNPTPHLRTISTPLHHSSMVPTPIRTPSAMRHSSLTSSLSREHQAWPSPVASDAQRFLPYGHNLPAPRTSNMEMSQQNYNWTATSCGPSSVETASDARFLPFGHNVPAPRTSNMEKSQQNYHRTTTSGSHPSVETAASSLIHPIMGSLPNPLEHPVGSRSAASQYRQPHAASVSSECTRIAPSQSSGAAGSLSLSDSLRGGNHREPVIPVKRQMTTERETSGQLFHQVLLDEECALYACRLKGRNTPEPVEPRPLNPVGKVLMCGDDTHFVPIRDIEFLVASPIGSAFSNYYAAT